MSIFDPKLKQSNILECVYMHNSDYIYTIYIYTQILIATYCNLSRLLDHTLKMRVKNEGNVMCPSTYYLGINVKIMKKKKIVLLNKTQYIFKVHDCTPLLTFYTVTVTIPLKVWVTCLSSEQSSDGKWGWRT